MCIRDSIKARMRQENAIYGGEMSGHYYFRENFYADNGMIPALLVLELLSRRGISLSDLLRPLRQKYHISGEINVRVSNPEKLLEEVEQAYADGRITHCLLYTSDAADDLLCVDLGGSRMIKQ